MELFYVLLGVLITLSVVYFWKFSRVNPLSKAAWALAIITVFMGAFSLGWVVESLIERETQAAGMGVLIFGGISILLFFGFRKIAKKSAVIKSKGQNIQG